MSSIYFRVWLPGRHSDKHPSMLTIENEDALYFFLEALQSESKTFLNRPFEVVAYYETEIVGKGNYTVKEKRSRNAKAQSGTRLVVHQETDVLKNFMSIAWKNVLSGSMPPSLDPYPLVPEVEESESHK